MKVICDRSDMCREAGTCGGAELHEYDEQECDHCPINDRAKCIEITNHNGEEK